MGIKPFRHWHEESSNDRDTLGLFHREPESEERSLGARALKHDDEDDCDD